MKADKADFKEIVDKIKQMDEDVEDLMDTREKLNTRMGRLEDKVSGYSGPKRGGNSGGGGYGNIEGSAAFKDLEDSLRKLRREFDDSKENYSLMF
jgi:hypothetical protein